jgi:hypothetical protein
MSLPNTEKVFWSRVIAGGRADCWLWTGGLHHQGYGRFKFKGKLRLAHRLSWEFTRGHIITTTHVLHRCDNPPCVNPNHLFLGSHLDNMRDMKSKNRHPHGERNGSSKITDKDVRRIRSLYKTELISHEELGLIFNINKATVTRIISKESWSHVADKIKETK